MKQTLRANLLSLADALGAGGGPSKPSIARQALNDNTFFTRVERDENFTIETYDRVISWMSANWPESVAWPVDVARPASAEAVA